MLNAVSMISVVVNSIVLLALVSMKHRQEWPRVTYNFFALFSCLLGSIVCLDAEKIVMRLFLNVADPSTCYWLAVTTVLLEIIRLWLIAFLSMESYLVLLWSTRVVLQNYRIHIKYGFKEGEDSGLFLSLLQLHLRCICLAFSSL